MTHAVCLAIKDITGIAKGFIDIRGVERKE
jgi:hypothetical protein